MVVVRALIVVGVHVRGEVLRVVGPGAVVGELARPIEGAAEKAAVVSRPRSQRRVRRRRRPLVGKIEIGGAVAGRRLKRAPGDPPPVETRREDRGVVGEDVPGPIGVGGQAEAVAVVVTAPQSPSDEQVVGGREDGQVLLGRGANGRGDTVDLTPVGRLVRR